MTALKSGLKWGEVLDLPTESSDTTPIGSDSGLEMVLEDSNLESNDVSQLAQE